MSFRYVVFVIIIFNPIIHKIIEDMMQHFILEQLARKIERVTMSSGNNRNKEKKQSPHLTLENGSEIAVIGNGPAGSFFTYFFLDLAERVDMKVSVDVFEQQDFSRLGPAGCNHCGGIVSESLVQLLSAEGINVPSDVLQRGIQSYSLHMDVGSARIETPLEEQRIAAIYRGAGPLGTKNLQWKSFDGHLQGLIEKKGAHIIHDRVKQVSSNSGRPHITTKSGFSKAYDLAVGSVGLKTSSLALFNELDFGYQPPKKTKTHICEFYLGRETIHQYFGYSMHVFLLDLPRLEFAAIVPKGEFVTLVMLGNKIDSELVDSFLNAPEVKRCFPPGMDLLEIKPCKCFPEINIKSATRPFADRVVLIGDCATSKLYKNGIGAAYITAKAAANTAIFHGVSDNDFQKHYWPACRKLTFDNTIGKVIFTATGLIQKTGFAKRGIKRRLIKEQKLAGPKRYMSSVFWDTFTGSATYSSIFLRMMDPRFFVPFTYEIAAGLFSDMHDTEIEIDNEESKGLGKMYKDGDIVVNQGDEGDCMYVIQSGNVEVFQKRGDKEVHLAKLGEPDFFGEMALFAKEVRSATIRSKGDSRILTVDKKTFLNRIQEDPSMAFRIVEKMSQRIRDLNSTLTRIKSVDRRNWEERSDGDNPPESSGTQ